MNAEERLRETEEVIARIANPHFKDKVSQAQVRGALVRDRVLMVYRKQ
jgi:hypothetical protein